MADDSCNDFDIKCIDDYYDNHSCDDCCCDDCKPMTNEDRLRMTEILIDMLSKHKAIMTRIMNMTSEDDTKFKYIVSIKEV